MAQEAPTGICGALGSESGPRVAPRLQEVIGTPWKDTQAKRLIKRLRRHQGDLFTFLDQPEVPFDHNAAERAIRPAVIIRKKQLRQPHRSAGRLPGGPHVDLPHPQTTGSQSNPDHHRRPGHLPHHRTTATTPQTESHFRSLNYYSTLNPIEPRWYVTRTPGG